MGRVKMKGKEDTVKCRVCDKHFKILNPEKFTKIFKYTINEDLKSAIQELSLEDFDLIQDEPFYQHLDLNQGKGYGMCPGARCKECDRRGRYYKLFETRNQRNYHMRHAHKVDDQLTGRTGFTSKIREEVMRQTQRLISQLQDEQNDWILKMPNIEVSMTDYKLEKKSEHIAKLSQEKQEEKQEHKKEMSKKRKKKEHEDTLAQLQSLLQEAGIED
mgnify:FL=1